MHGSGDMYGRGCVWHEGMCGRGACVARVCMVGVCGRGHAWQEHVWQGDMVGTCMAGGMHGREACMAGEMAMAAGGTHPIGMHSCLLKLQLMSTKLVIDN